MYNNFKNIFIVSCSTILSRISGFVRDAFFFGIFGISEISASFLFAFTIPNLFRQLLGEGALSSAIIPILSNQYIKHGKDAVYALLNKIILRLSFVLLIIIIVICSLAFFITRCSFLEYKWIISSHFIILVLPYMLFVCIAAIVSAALNVLGYFLAASLNAIWLNLSMILALIIGKFLKLSDLHALDLLSIGVVGGGIIQCLVPIIALRRNKNINIKTTRTYSDELREILALFWPGFFGAAIAQINLLISRSLAYFYCASSVSILYLANRLIELPLGIFAISISTVFFPDISKAAIDSENPNILNKSFNCGIFSLLWILLPSALGLFCVRKEILTVFFEWGNFGISDTIQILPILSIYCISIPFYGILSFLIRNFHAIKDMKTPVYIGCAILFFNIIATIILMNILGIIGIALANTITIILQTHMLYSKLHKKQQIFDIKIAFSKIVYIIIGLLSISGLISFGKLFIKSDLNILLCLTPLAALSYLIMTYPVLKIKTK